MATIVFDRKTRLSFKQVTQPRNAEMTATGHFREPGQRILIQEAHGLFNPQISFNTLHEAYSFKVAATVLESSF
jgi:hypothetical protein